MSRRHLPNSLQLVLERIDRMILEAPAPSRDHPESLHALYLCHCRDELQFTPQSLRQQYYYSRYFLRWFSERQLAFPTDIGPNDIEAFLNFQRDNRGNSLTQQRHYLVTLRRFFQLLLRDGWIDHDPTLPFHLKAPKRLNVRHILSLDELRALLQTAREDRDLAPPRFLSARIRDAALVGLIATTGCRIAEALALIRCRIDLQRQLAFFPGKGSFRHAVQERVVPLEDPDVCQDLELWLEKRPVEPDTLVFVTPSGKIVEPHHVHDKLRRLARLAGIRRKVTPHGLRATFASRLVENGIDPLALQQLMGHGHLATTLSLYVELDSDTLHHTWRQSNPLAALDTDSENRHE